MAKKTKWFEVAENESIDDCFIRIQKEGYTVIGRREEPVFAEIDGEIRPIHQKIEFKGQLLEE